MRKFLNSTIETLGRVIARIGQSMAWLVLAMVLVTFVVVVLRYAFNLGWIWLQELVLYLHAAVFMLGAAWTLARDGHVRVDMFYQKLPAARQRWVNLVGILVLLLPFCAFALWISADYVLRSWQLLEGSQETGGLNAVFILKSLIPLMAVLLGLQGLVWLNRLLFDSNTQGDDAAGQEPVNVL